MCYEEVAALCRGVCRQGSETVRFMREELKENCVASCRAGDVTAT